MNTMPGLDILQQWMQSARGAVPGLQPWASPTLDPDEIGKRIEELRTVQFWLEQNAKLIGSSIQALEVQRMTLATLKNLNVPLADIGAAFRLPEMPEAAPERPAWPPAASPAPAPAPAPSEAKADAPAAGPAGEPGASGGAGAAPLADPMQWWGSLTQQFATLAGQAMKDSAAAAQAAAAQATAASATTPPKPAVAKRTRPASQGAGAAAKRSRSAAATSASRSTPATASGTTGAKTRKPR